MLSSFLIDKEDSLKYRKVVVRKIKNPFNYLNYTVLLNDDFMARTTTNHSYSLRAYARDLGLSPAFLSEVLRGRKVLSVPKSKMVFTKLGFDESEIEYVKNLVIAAGSTNPADQQSASAYISSKYNRVGYEETLGRTKIIETVEHFVVYCLTRKISNLKVIQTMALEFNISSEKTISILNDFIAEGYIKESNGEYFVTDLMLVVRTDKKMVEIAEHFTLKIIDLLKIKGGNNLPEASASGLVLGLDKESFKLAAETHAHFIKSMNRIASQSKSTDRFVYISNFFITTHLN